MDEPRMRKMEATENGGVRIDMAPGELLQQFVEAMKTNLQEHDAPNYVESEFADRNTGERWTLLVQRAEGLTPGNKAAMAEERYNRLNHHYEEVKALVMEALGNGANQDLWKPGMTWWDAACRAIQHFENHLQA